MLRFPLAATRRPRIHHAALLVAVVLLVGYAFGVTAERKGNGHAADETLQQQPMVIASRVDTFDEELLKCKAQVEELNQRKCVDEELLKCEAQIEELNKRKCVDKELLKCKAQVEELNQRKCVDKDLLKCKAQVEVLNQRKCEQQPAMVVQQPSPVSSPPPSSSTSNINRQFDWEYSSKVLGGWTPLVTSTNPASRRPNSIRVILEHPLITQTRQVMAKYKSPVYLQFFDHSFLEMTYNWICNVVPFNPLLDRVVFVVTDKLAYDSVLSFSKEQIEPRGQPRLRVVLIEFKPIGANDGPLTYGELQYYDYMFFRSGLMLQLLMSGIDFMVIESDSVWLADPSDALFSHKEDFVSGVSGNGPFDGERVGAVNGVRLGTNRGVQHGFSLFRSTTRTVEYYTTLLAHFEDMINNKHSGLENEQGVIVKLLTKFPELRFQFFEENKFRTGLYWFPKDLPAGAPKPMVIQNNYVIGGKTKLARAREAGYWFLDDKMNCDDAATKRVLGG